MGRHVTWMTVVVVLLMTSGAGHAQDCGVSVIVRFGFSSPPSINPPQGATISLTCFPSDESSYIWQRNGQTIPPEQSSMLTVAEGGQYGCGVLLPSCNATVFSSNSIAVNTVPQISEAGAVTPTALQQGDSFSLRCSATGWPPPTLQWLLEGTATAGPPGPNLTVMAATPQDAGSYTCLASNLRGSASSQPVVVTVTAVATATAPETATSPVTTPSTPSLATTGPSLATTDQSLATTDQSLATTDPSLATTAPSLATTGPSLATTGPSLATTGPSLATTDQSLSTTDATDQSLATTQSTSTEGSSSPGPAPSSAPPSEGEGLPESAVVLVAVLCAVAALLTAFTLFTVSCCCYHEICQRPRLKKRRRRVPKPPPLDKVELLPSSARINRQSAQSRDVAGLSCVNMAFGQEGTDGSDGSTHSSLRNLPPMSSKPPRPHRGAVLVAKTTKLEPQRYSLPSRSTDTAAPSSQRPLPPPSAPPTAAAMDAPPAPLRKKQTYSEGKIRRPLSFGGFGKKNQSSSADSKDKASSKPMKPFSKQVKPVSSAAATPMGGANKTANTKERKAFFKRSKVISTPTTVRTEERAKHSGPILQQVRRPQQQREGGDTLTPAELPLSAAVTEEPTVTTLQEWGTPANSVTISQKTGETTVAMEQVDDGDVSSVGEEEVGESEEEEEEGDQTQLVPAQQSSTDQPTDHSYAELATILGRRPSFVKKLCRSHPLTVSEATHLAYVGEELTPSHPLFQEYNAVPFNSVQTLEQSLVEKQKNRYRNVLPNPHSAVKLQHNGEDGSSYINANFIRGFDGAPKAYIATQGPIPESIDDFWRMVWEHDVTIIVMITALVERGKHKCVRYWPSASSSAASKYGDLLVNSNFEEKTAHYRISYLSVAHSQQRSAPRDVYHFSCTAWPDFGVPQESAGILRLQEVVAGCRSPSSNGPVLVHCSAGLGRSGTFMAVDMGVQQFQREGVVDPLKYLCELRKDRGGMIQTPEQYAYVHKALADYMVTRP